MSNYRRSRKDLGIVGSKPALWEKPGHLNNSQLTLTSRRLSQNALYAADNIRKQSKHGVAWDSDTSSAESIQLATDMPLHQKKSVTFNRRKTTPLTNGGLENGVVNGEVSSTNSDVSSSSGRYGSTRHWYTNPVHLSARDMQRAYSANSQALNGSAIPTSETSVMNAGSNSRGAFQNMPLNANSTALQITQNDNSLPSMDQIAQEYFPLTLSAAYALNDIDPNKINVISPPAKALSKPAVPWKSNKHSRSHSRRNRPGSAQSSSSSTSRNSIDKMYMMHAEAPSIAGSANVLLSSPFQSELATLRMDRLRIEEDHLLEVKRQEELERIRGPQPKWYELKSPKFHYEAHKNNELLKCSSDWQSLLDYRNELESASQQFRKSNHST